MPNVLFVSSAGDAHEIEIPVGWSLMQGAVQNGVPGILAECGGSCACATCHVYVDPDWFDRLPPKPEGEDDMLSCVEEQRPNSRLSCQIRISEDMVGLRVEVPESQG